jgi:TPR repeat protein/tRNA A-37 threonylcarbamoyl transferase component Bud32
MPSCQLKYNVFLQGGKYRILKVLGQGGFGITYLAEQCLLKKKVAIKEFFIHDLCTRDDSSKVYAVSQSDMVKRYRQKFFKEAQIIARFNHIGIVKVSYIFEENGTVYYVMEYVEGESLAEIVNREKRLPEQIALQYIFKVAKALDYIHQSKVNHLDIKPANIMIRHDDNEPIIIDFGVSKQYDEYNNQTTTTPPGVSIGYSPIEQYRPGGVSTFSPQADIYALGATLYKLLTGNTPPVASDLINAGFPPMSNISSNVRKAIEKAMQPRLLDRQKNISEFVEMLMMNSVKEERKNLANDKTRPVDDPNSSMKGKIKSNDVESVNDEDNIKHLIKQLSSGDKESVDQLLDFFLDKKVSKELKQNAFIQIKKVAELGNVDAQLVLGGCLLNGEGVAEDKVEAVRWLRKAAQQGNADAQYCLGEYYFGREGVEDKVEAVRWFKKAGSHGNDEALFSLGICYYSGEGVAEDKVEAVRWFKKAADLGNADAQFFLGVCYYGGEGVHENKTEAIRWFRMAVEEEDADFHAEAQYYLGLCYLNGEGVKENKVNATQCFRKSAELGSADAQYQLGLCYYGGEGVKENKTKAAQWFRKSAEQGDVDAQYYIGLCCYHGEGVDVDKVEAVRWFRKVTDQKDALFLSEAQYYLGLCYLNGEGINEIKGMAIHYFRKASELGNADAQHLLGLCYYYGNGVTEDKAEAVRCFRNVVEIQNSNFNAEAQYYIGLCYLNGEGVPKDKVEAISWFQKAAKQGYRKAQVKNSSIRYRNLALLITFILIICDVLFILYFVYKM